MLEPSKAVSHSGLQATEGATRAPCAYQELFQGLSYFGKVLDKAPVVSDKAQKRPHLSDGVSDRVGYGLGDGGEK